MSQLTSSNAKSKGAPSHKMELISHMASCARSGSRRRKRTRGLALTTSLSRSRKSPTVAKLQSASSAHVALASSSLSSIYATARTLLLLRIRLPISPLTASIMSRASSSTTDDVGSSAEYMGIMSTRRDKQTWSLIIPHKYPSMLAHCNSANDMETRSNAGETSVNMSMARRMSSFAGRGCNPCSPRKLATAGCGRSSHAVSVAASSCTREFSAGTAPCCSERRCAFRVRAEMGGIGSGTLRQLPLDNAFSGLTTWGLRKFLVKAVLGGKGVPPGTLPTDHQYGTSGSL